MIPRKLRSKGGPGNGAPRPRASIIAWDLTCLPQPGGTFYIHFTQIGLKNEKKVDFSAFCPAGVKKRQNFPGGKGRRAGAGGGPKGTAREPGQEPEGGRGGGAEKRRAAAKSPGRAEKSARVQQKSRPPAKGDGKNAVCERGDGTKRPVLTARPACSPQPAARR